MHGSVYRMHAAFKSLDWTRVPEGFCIIPELVSVVTTLTTPIKSSVGAVPALIFNVLSNLGAHRDPS